MTGDLSTRSGNRLLREPAVQAGYSGRILGSAVRAGWIGLGLGANVVQHNAELLPHAGFSVRIYG